MLGQLWLRATSEYALEYFDKTSRRKKHAFKTKIRKVMAISKEEDAEIDAASVGFQHSAEEAVMDERAGEILCMLAERRGKEPAGAALETTSISAAVEMLEGVRSNQEKIPAPADLPGEIRPDQAPQPTPF